MAGISPRQGSLRQPAVVRYLEHVESGSAGFKADEKVVRSTLVERFDTSTRLTVKALSTSTGHILAILGF